MRKCGHCGQPGHNRRTCAALHDEAEEVVVVEKPKKKKKVSKCRDCGEEGHTAKKCPYKPPPEGADIGPKMMECGHWSWWHRNGECELCTKVHFYKHFEDDEEQEAA